MSGPFDKARYAALLEGLEISEIRKSELERTLRFDSEFFLHRYREVQAKLACQKLKTIPKLVDVSDGNHFSISDDFVDDGIPYYRGQDVVGHFFIEQSAPVHIPQPSFDRPYMMRSHLKKGDVLLSIVGTIGELSLVTQDRPATCSCKLAILRPRAKSISPEYLAVFLRSRYGRGQIERLTRGAIQMSFLLEDMDQAVIPRFSPAFEEAIDKTVRQSHVQLNDAEEKMHTAEQTLIAALGLADWHPPEPLTYTHFRKEVFEAKRLDSEYFSPKFEALKSELELRHTLKTLQSIGDVLKGVTVAYSDEGQFPIIRSGDLSDISVDDRFKRSSEVNDIFYLKKGDILLASIGFGAIGKVQVFDREGRYGTVSEVTVVRQHYFNSYYLAAYLRSVAGQMQIERYITGATGQLHLYPKDVAKIFVPVIPVAQQRYFETLALQAASSKSEARALLSRAQRAVEIAIEEDEASALRFLKEKGV